MIHVAILGFGVVGGGTAEVLTQNHDLLEKTLGQPLSLKRILDLREFPGSPFASLVTHDINDILNDRDISIVVEAMGGLHPAYDFTKAALAAGKSVVTSNKQVVASRGAELLALAKEKGVRYLFEASVGGGIPVIGPLRRDLAANRVTRIDGILNGTTNYILTRMLSAGVDFGAALAEAQQKGYAEADPAADVEGHDAARKIVILAALAFGKLLCPERILCRGVGSVTTDDMQTAEAFGCVLKLIGHAEKIGERVLCTVEPRLLPAAHPLASINDVFNGILIEGDTVGRVWLCGPGAGKLPTASAVAGDVIEAAAHPAPPAADLPFRAADEEDYADAQAAVSAFCFSFAAGDDAREKIAAVPGQGQIIAQPGRISCISAPMTRRDAEKAAAAVGLPLLSLYPLL